MRVEKAAISQNTSKWKGRAIENPVNRIKSRGITSFQPKVKKRQLETKLTHYTMKINRRVKLMLSITWLNSRLVIY